MNAPITTYTEMIRGIDAARMEMGLRHLDFEELAGMTQGHWGKAAGQLQVKKLGIEKVFDALRAAGLRIRLEIDPEQREKMTARASENYNPMQANQARPSHSSSLPSTAVLTRILKPIGKIGGKRRWAKKSKRERSEHMRMMSNARWKAERKRRKAAQIRRRRAKQSMGAQPIHSCP